MCLNIVNNINQEPFPNKSQLHAPTSFKGAGLAVDTDGKISGGAADLVINNGKLPGSVTSIGDGAFQDSGLASDNGTVDISDFIDNGKLNSVGKDAFAGVDVGDVDTITIPDTITSIDDGAFAGQCAQRRF